MGFSVSSDFRDGEVNTLVVNRRKTTYAECHLLLKVTGRLVTECLDSNERCLFVPVFLLHRRFAVWEPSRIIGESNSSLGVLSTSGIDLCNSLIYNVRGVQPYSLNSSLVLPLQLYN